MGRHNPVPGYFCGPFSIPSCAVPFTFGVPLTFDITLSASAVEELQSGSPLAIPITVGSSAEFDGISNFFTDANGVEIGAQATITEVPEPASLWLVSGGGLMLLGLIFKLPGCPRINAQGQEGQSGRSVTEHESRWQIPC